MLYVEYYLPGREGHGGLQAAPQLYEGGVGREGGGRAGQHWGGRRQGIAMGKELMGDYNSTVDNTFCVLFTNR